MKVLVINCGSSSIKYQLYDAEIEQAIAKGIVAKINEEGSYITLQSARKKQKCDAVISSHRDGLHLIIQMLLDPEFGVLHNIAEISAVGHRAVHGGQTFVESTLVNNSVLRKLEECIPLAPLHNPANLLGIQEAQRILPHVPQVAVFDTAFHQTMPSFIFNYALPYELLETSKVRKYGFHGISCKYVSNRVSEILNVPRFELKMVICHLGNGVTISALSGGKSFDTSIGFATCSGVMMGTRCGDIDPGIVFYLHRELGYRLDEIEEMLYRKSGLLGVSGISNDVQEIVEHANAGNVRCQLALKMFSYQIKKFIGAYIAVLGGIQVLVFTAGIGENSSTVRQMVCEGLEPFGIKLSHRMNTNSGEVERIISGEESEVAVLVVPTDEEKMIAMDTLAVIHGDCKL